MKKPAVAGTGTETRRVKPVHQPRDDWGITLRRDAELRIMNSADFAFLHPLHVRWAECDGQGIVFNANYFAFYDHAIWEWTKALGYRGWEDAPQFVTAHAECDFKGAARFDDDLRIGIRAARFGTKSMEIRTAIFRGDDLLNVGKLNYVYVKSGTTEPAPLPDEFIARVTAFEKVRPERK